jgi:peptidoglycan/LPS O-acetylase OafA/YrhL
MFSKISPRTSASAPANASRLHYLPGLDGLRALAVLAVLLYHADIVWLPGGFLGVEVFFVVSGYLITSLLLAEYRTRHTIHLKQFWQRRARRLLPALFAMLIAVLVYMVLWLPDEVAGIRSDVVAAFTYATNWYLIAAQKSYFESVGRPSLLQHLWSLAVEEQFYLIWPLFFTFVLTRLKTRGALWLLMLGATLSALWMGILYQPDVDPSRVYYGTDTRASGLLIGAALAFVWAPKASDAARRWQSWLLDAVGWIALGGLFAAFLFLDEFNPFLYQGGMLLVAVATAFVIAAVVHPKSPLLGPLLGVGVLQWIGLRSYSLYLWHWPLFMVTRPQLDTSLEGMPLLLFRFGVAFALAEISYRFVEAPIRGGALGRAWNAWTQMRGVRRWSFGAASFLLSALLLSGGVILGNAVANAQPPPEPELVLAAPPDDSTTLPPDEAALLEANQNDAASPSSSDMTSISFVMPEEMSDDVPSAAPAPKPTAPIVDSWVRRIALARAPTIYVQENDFDSAFRRDLPRNQKTARPCFSSCLALQDFREMKGDRVKPEVVPPRPALATSSPVTATVTAPIPSAEPPQILAIGDSVMLGASNYLRKTMGTLLVDAQLGRQVPAAIQLLQQYQDANRLPSTVVIHLGNNGTFNAKQFDELMAVLRDVPRVVFLTDKVPRKWQDANNTALEEGVKRYPNAALIDWNAASAQHPEWFWKDGIHLNPDGAQVYANLIAATLNDLSAHP